MPIKIAILFLILPFIQQPDKVALVFGPEPSRIVIIKRSEAEKLYKEVKKGSLIGKVYTKEENDRLFAALTVALGTLPDRERLTAPPVNTRERLDWEIRRGVRQPLRKPEAVKP